ncbi:MAG: hypothetical protein B7Y83_05570 [Flavobacteriales bacterium 32-34-25]|nr:MAG: hypothetical protein B7Y83_05570 [Flavobacteriales bacterium 32-34-25]
MQMRTKNTNWNYLIKHWVFTLLLGPFISQILMYITILHPNKIVGLLEVYPIAIIFSIVFSIPTYIIYAFIYYYFSNKILTVLFTKTILISLAVIGIFATLKIIGGTISLDIAISYSIASIITGLFFKLNFKDENDL